MSEEMNMTPEDERLYANQMIQQIMNQGFMNGFIQGATWAAKRTNTTISPALMGCILQEHMENFQGILKSTDVKVLEKDGVFAVIPKEKEGDEDGEED